MHQFHKFTPAGNSTRFGQFLCPSLVVYSLYCRSKFGKLVHFVGFIVKKFVTMHGHMNVKLKYTSFRK